MLGTSGVKEEATKETLWNRIYTVGKKVKHHVRVYFKLQVVYCLFPFDQNYSRKHDP